MSSHGHKKKKTTLTATQSENDLKDQNRFSIEHKSEYVNPQTKGILQVWKRKRIKHHIRINPGSGHLHRKMSSITSGFEKQWGLTFKGSLTQITLLKTIKKQQFENHLYEDLLTSFRTYAGGVENCRNGNAPGIEMLTGITFLTFLQTQLTRYLEMLILPPSIYLAANTTVSLVFPYRPHYTSPTCPTRWPFKVVPSLPHELAASVMSDILINYHPVTSRRQPQLGPANLQNNSCIKEG